MSVLSGDYIGFSYNNVHSSELGIIRVSEGSRFNENLLPTSKDVTIQVPGGDGTYYFGSYYTQRIINISYAFDSLSEYQLEYIKELFGDKKIHPLVFDEYPYKTYYAKVTGSSTLKHIPFTQDGRIFKGEGTLQFTCYSPYAVCHKKFLSEYGDIDINEWAGASNLLQERGDINEIFSDVDEIKVYNPGVKPTDWRLTFDFEEEKHLGGVVISLEENFLEFAPCQLKGQDNRIVFNSKNKLIEGYELVDGTYVKSGNLYNEYLITGDFFDIPTTIKKTTKETIKTTKVFVVSGDMKKFATNLDYDYYYF